MTQPTKSKYASTLTPEQVAKIRAAPLPTRHADLARQFNVTPTTVARIRRGLTWPVERPEHVRVPVPANAVAGLEEAARRAGVTPAELLAKSALTLGAAESEQGNDRKGKRWPGSTKGRHDVDD